MSSHDYVLANDTGANFRADLNLALLAIQSQNSGSSEPSTTYAYQWWADTGNDLLKQRNAANNAWISILTLSTGTPSVGIASLAADTSPQLGGDLDCNGAQIQWSQGADVASATALAVLTDGNYFDVTGTTTITSINTTGGVGTQIKLHFDGALTLTHHATDLILPGGANITTAAGDEAEFIEYATGDYRCTNYSKASGEAVVAASGGVALGDNPTWTGAHNWTATASTPVTIAGGGSGIMLSGTATTTNMNQFSGNSLTSGGVLLIYTANSSFTGQMFSLGINDSSASGTTLAMNNQGTGDLIKCQNSTAGKYFFVKTDGDCENSNNAYGAFSDVRLKTNIVDASSQLEDIKALRIRKYNLKTDPDGPLQLGLIGQEAELVSPGLVRESPEEENYYDDTDLDQEGNPILKSRETGKTIKTLKYSILYMKNVKATQELAALVEAQAATIADLTSRIEALEAA